jgi:hypothetical protein
MDNGYNNKNYSKIKSKVKYFGYHLVRSSQAGSAHKQGNSRGVYRKSSYINQVAE